jgi:probable 2-oxoglutarate dehydrogenase E1 component DHKTD1
MEPGTRFQPVLDDPMAAKHKEKVKRVIMLSGKIYYELIKARHDRSLDQDVALIRIEELAPFPFAVLESVLRGYTNAREWVWVQEEPRNQGAWGHVGCRIESLLERMGVEVRLRYVGRRESAVPAPGIGGIYQRQQGEVLGGAFGGM